MENRNCQVRVAEGNITITPELAREILKDCRFDGQRTVFGHQVSLLKTMMARGEWIPRDQITFCETPDGRQYLVNGYHRMNAIVEFGAAVEMTARVIRVPDMATVRGVYATFDISTRKRTDAEILKASGIIERYGLRPEVARAVLNAAPLIANRCHYYNYQNMPAENRGVLHRIQTAEGYWQTGKAYAEHLANARPDQRRRLLIAAITAVGILTVRYQPKLAAEFWPVVATMASQDGSPISIDDPRLVLAKAIGERKYQHNMKDGEVPEPCYHVAQAWNAFYDGRGIKIVRKCQTYCNFVLKGLPTR